MESKKSDSRETRADDVARYGRTAIALHWLVFALFLTNFTIAYQMQALEPGPDKWALFDLHKAIGSTFIFILFWRIGYRLIRRPPALPQSLPLWQTRAARASHLLLYCTMIVMPLSAYVGSKAGDFSVSWFGVFEMPDILYFLRDSYPELLGRKKFLHFWGNEIHRLNSYVIYGLVGVHVSAALWHQFVRRDGVLPRMLPAFMSPRTRAGLPNDSR